MLPVLQFVAYQLVWFACAFSDVWEMPWLGPLCALAYLFWVSRDVPLAWRAAGTMAAVGMVLDTCLIQLGFLGFDSSPWPIWLPPPWMISLWACFAIPLITTFGWMATRPLLAFALGAIGGPMAYLAGAKLGAIGLGESATMSLIAIGLVWGAITPVAVIFGQKWVAEFSRQGHEPTSVETE